MNIDKLKKLAGIKKEERWKAGGIPYCIEDDVVYVCLVTPTDPAYGGDKPSVPKGNPDAGDTPESCARREVSEETGITSFVSVNKLMTEKITGLDRTYEMHVFAMETRDRSKLRPDFEGIPEWYDIDTALNICRRSHKIFVQKLADKLK